MRKIFLCGDCPKYGEPVEHFHDVVNYAQEVKKAMMDEVNRIIVMDGGEIDSSELPGNFVEAGTGISEPETEKEDTL